MSKGREGERVSGEDGRGKGYGKADGREMVRTNGKGDNGMGSGIGRGPR